MQRLLLPAFLLLVFRPADSPAASPDLLFSLTDDQGWCMMSERMHPEIPESAIADLPTNNGMTGFRLVSFQHTTVRVTPLNRAVAPVA